MKGVTWNGTVYVYTKMLWANRALWPHARPQLFERDYLHLPVQSRFNSSAAAAPCLSEDCCI